MMEARKWVGPYLHKALDHIEVLERRVVEQQAAIKCTLGVLENVTEFGHPVGFDCQVPELAERVAEDIAEICEERDTAKERIAELEDKLTKTRERVVGYQTLGAKVNEIRNSIVGYQNVNWSAHIYPLVAALEEAGYKGDGYEKANKMAKTQLECIAELVKLLRCILNDIDSLEDPSDVLGVYISTEWYERAHSLIALYVPKETGGCAGQPASGGQRVAAAEADDCEARPSEAPVPTTEERLLDEEYDRHRSARGRVRK